MRSVQREFKELSDVVLPFGVFGYSIDVYQHVNVGRSSMTKAHTLGQDTIPESIVGCKFGCFQVERVLKYFVGLKKNRNSSGSTVTPLNPIFHALLIIDYVSIIKLACKNVVNSLSQIHLDGVILNEFRYSHESN